MKGRKQMDNILFPIERTFNPNAAEEEIMLEKIKTIISAELKMNISSFQRLSLGQNINYKVCTDKEENPKYLLRIITRKGYPSINTLLKCYDMLSSINIRDLEIVYYDTTSRVAPYGYFLQSWVEGNNGDTEMKFALDSNSWVEDFALISRQVHTIEMPYFGYIGDGPKYESIQQYFYNTDKIIDYSFGDIFKDKFSIWDLERKGITSSMFITETFNKVRSQAYEIKSPVKSVLLHGDMFPENMVYTKKGPVLIDWDETRAGWWIYEIARNHYYMNSKDIYHRFIKAYGDESVSMKEVNTGIKLEQVRQMLRQLCMCAFNINNKEEIKEKVRAYEEKINLKLENDLF